MTGLSRDNYSAMHGCVRTEKCSNADCQTEYFRDYDIGGMSFQPTGRYCIVCKKSTKQNEGKNAAEEQDKEAATASSGGSSGTASQGDDNNKELQQDDAKVPNENSIEGGENGDINNGQKVISESNTASGVEKGKDTSDGDGDDDSVGGGHPLHDTLLDWNDPLPEDDFEYIQQLIEKPNTLVVCLGTSLRIEPIGLLPLQATEFVIVNLQKTPRDDEASLIIRCNVDTVMEYVMKHININSKEKICNNNGDSMVVGVVSTSTNTATTTTITSTASDDTAVGTTAASIERVWTPPPTRLNLASMLP